MRVVLIVDRLRGLCDVDAVVCENLNGDVATRREVLSGDVEYEELSWMWEIELSPPSCSVKGRLHKHLNFWKTDLNASSMVLNTIEYGYVRLCCASVGLCVQPYGGCCASVGLCVQPSGGCCASVGLCVQPSGGCVVPVWDSVFSQVVAVLCQCGTLCSAQ